MNISHNKYDTIEGIIFNEGLRISSVQLNTQENKLEINLNSNLTIVSPIKNYSNLKTATIKQLKNYRLVSNGIGIHWPELDEDLSLKGLLKEFLTKKINSKRKLIIA